MKKLNVLVTGSGGMLGSAVVPYFKKQGTNLLSTSRTKNSTIVEKVLDVTEFNSFEKFVKQHKPDLILHLAAETSLEFCEENPDNAYKTNTLGVHNAAILSEKYNCTLVYISTAGVFDGKKKMPYIEADEPNPIMVYGRSKYEGEKFVREYCKRYFIVRAGWMVGGMDKDKKFVSLIVDQLAKGQKLIKAVDDKFGTPTYAPFFASNLFGLIQTEFYGTYHMACDGIGSRYDVAKEIVKLLGLHKTVKVKPVPSSYFKERYYVVRPKSEAMRNANLELRGINQMGHWKDGLKQYVKDLYKIKK